MNDVLLEMNTHNQLSFITYDPSGNKHVYDRETQEDCTIFKIREVRIFGVSFLDHLEEVILIPRCLDPHSGLVLPQIMKFYTEILWGFDAVLGSVVLSLPRTMGATFLIHPDL